MDGSLNKMTIDSTPNAPTAPTLSSPSTVTNGLSPSVLDVNTCNTTSNGHQNGGRAQTSNINSTDGTHVTSLSETTHKMQVNDDEEQVSKQQTKENINRTLTLKVFCEL